MNFLFANAHELAALMELPWIQRVTYLMGIRPYMDRQSNIVGIKRRISYQSLREVLYVGPIAGVQTGSPSRQQVKRAVKSLARAGLVEIQSTDKNLILKCPLAALDKTAPNKADLRPTPQANTKPTQQEAYKAGDSDIQLLKGDNDLNHEADPPQKSEFNYVCVLRNFEKFWQTYPQPTGKKAAFEAFKKLNPDGKLFREIIGGLKRQVSDHQMRLDTGHWVAQWKYPANWLGQECWKDELPLYEATQIKPSPRPYYAHKKPDILWDSCKDASYEFDED